MSENNTVLGAAFAELMKTHEIKTVPEPSEQKPKLNVGRSLVKPTDTTQQTTIAMNTEITNQESPTPATDQEVVNSPQGEQHPMETIAPGVTVFVGTIEDLKTCSGEATQAFVSAGDDAGQYTKTEAAPVENAEAGVSFDRFRAHKHAVGGDRKDWLREVVMPDHERDYFKVWTEGAAPEEQKNQDAPAQESDYPDPEAVLNDVEVRTSTPRHKKPMKTHSQAQQQPAKKAPALFALSSDRPASAYLSQIFDVNSIDGVDGEHHINIHNDAVTKLGRMLDMNAKTPFVHPNLGSFQSVGGMWHYIKTRPMVEEFRILHGAKLRHTVNQMKDNPNGPGSITVAGFKTIMADAMWHKVTQNAELVTLMSGSELPFEHYFIQGDPSLNLRQYPSEGYWCIAAFEEIRRVIKARLATGDNTIDPEFHDLERMRNPRESFNKPNQHRNHRHHSPSPYGKPREGGGYFGNRA